MSRSNRQAAWAVVQRRIVGSWRARCLTWALAAALAGVMAAAIPAPAAAAVARSSVVPHRPKPLKTLPTLKTAKSPPVIAGGPVSPYALAAAKRSASGQPPPGHAHVLQRSASNPVQ
ncbi:MAG: hypothetical protein WA642_01120 [Steroidobacteraceae bacterium]